eukprot:ANDGO_05811.mRNA.1 hypothetical protein
MSFASTYAKPLNLILNVDVLNPTNPSHRHFFSSVSRKFRVHVKSCRTSHSLSRLIEALGGRTVLPSSIPPSYPKQMISPSSHSRRSSTIDLLTQSTTVTFRNASISPDDLSNANHSSPKAEQVFDGEPFLLSPDGPGVLVYPAVSRKLRLGWVSGSRSGSPVNDLSRRSSVANPGFNADADVVEHTSPSNNANSNINNINNNSCSSTSNVCQGTVPVAGGGGRCQLADFGSDCLCHNTVIFDGELTIWDPSCYPNIVYHPSMASFRSRGTRHSMDAGPDNFGMLPASSCPSGFASIESSRAQSPINGAPIISFPVSRALLPGSVPELSTNNDSPARSNQHAQTMDLVSAAQFLCRITLFVNASSMSPGGQGGGAFRSPKSSLPSLMKSMSTSSLLGRRTSKSAVSPGLPGLSTGSPTSAASPLSCTDVRTYFRNEARAALEVYRLILPSSSLNAGMDDADFGASFLGSSHWDSMASATQSLSPGHETRPFFNISSTHVSARNSPNNLSSSPVNGSFSPQNRSGSSLEESSPGAYLYKASSSPVMLQSQQPISLTLPEDVFPRTTNNKNTPVPLMRNKSQSWISTTGQNPNSNGRNVSIQEDAEETAFFANHSMHPLHPSMPSADSSLGGGNGNNNSNVNNNSSNVLLGPPQSILKRSPSMQDFERRKAELSKRTESFLNQIHTTHKANSLASPTLMPITEDNVMQWNEWNDRCKAASETLQKRYKPKSDPKDVGEDQNAGNENELVAEFSSLCIGQVRSWVIETQIAAAERAAQACEASNLVVEPVAIAPTKYEPTRSVSSTGVRRKSLLLSTTNGTAIGAQKVVAKTFTEVTASELQRPRPERPASMMQQQQHSGAEGKPYESIVKGQIIDASPVPVGYGGNLVSTSRRNVSVTTRKSMQLPVKT